MNEREKMIKVIKERKNLEGFARESIQAFADENHLTVGDAFSLLLESLKEHCTYNFFGCNDTEGHRIAYEMDQMEEAFGKKNLTCQDICEHGCCAYINQMLYAIGMATLKSKEDEA